MVASYDHDWGRPRQRRLVVKHLTGRARREARILQDLKSGSRLVADLLGTIRGNEGQIYLGLEDVRRASVWPWRDSTITAALMRELGRFHETIRHAVLGDDWDYEQELGAKPDLFVVGSGPAAYVVESAAAPGIVTPAGVPSCRKDISARSAGGV